ncbi:hypothetical protein V5D56_01750 [Cellulosimicrobium sp. PMB13]|uniref:hypothetical protein n=1 Tax=Cellulosimicrobium sp. PMB13 TaxID=3120158 RepID=UPI003F4BC29E
MSAARRTGGLLLALGLLAAVVACTGSAEPSEPAPAPDALASYADAGQALRADVQDVFGADGWTDGHGPAATEQDDGRCVVFLQDAHATRAGASPYDRLEDVPDAIASTLAEHGFGEPSDVVHPEHGGSAHVEAEDPAGWSVRVAVDGDVVRLDLSGPVALDPCDEAGLPALG